MGNIVVLISGKGTNLKNIIDTIHGRKIIVKRVISDKSDAEGLKYCSIHGIDFCIVSKKSKNFDKRVVEEIKSVSFDLVVLAGFTSILGSYFTDRVKAINIHPTLLPTLKGLNGIERSYYSSSPIAGVTVHYVSSEVDSGSIIAQKCIKKIDGESYESFVKRIKELEYYLLPRVILMLI